MLITIGFAIISFGVGLFVGQHLSKSDFFKSKIEKYKIKAEQKRKEELILKQIQDDARIEALKELKPEFKEHIKKQEIEKLNKKSEDKMQKFANMFSMNDSNNQNSISSEDKLNKMLGNSGSFNTDTNKIMGTMNRPQFNTETYHNNDDDKQKERDRILSFLK